MKQDLKYSKDLFEMEYFSIIDISWALIFIVLLFLISKNQKKKYEELEYFEYYSKNISWKVFLSLIYAIYYIIVI